MASGWSWDPTEEQQRYYELLGDVCAYGGHTSRVQLILCKKVGYAIYGVPDEESKCSNIHTGYSEKKNRAITKVVDVIKKVHKEKKRETDEIQMAIIFVFVENKEIMQYPVFRVHLTETTWKFVDTDCRVYSSWKDFLDCNVLPEGKLCCPVDGIYGGDPKRRVQLWWGITPAANPIVKRHNATDATIGAIAAAATVVGVFSPLSPIISLTTACAGAYTCMNSAIKIVSTLVDRSQHGQTVKSLRDSKAVKPWLSMAGRVVVKAMEAVAKTAEQKMVEGLDMDEARSRLVLELISGALDVMAATISDIGEDHQTEEATSLNVFQFSASLLFYAHATVDFQTATQILKEIERKGLEALEKTLKCIRQRKGLDRSMNTSAAGESMSDGNYRVIRDICSICSKDDFFAGIILTGENLRGRGTIFSSNGKIIVNGGAEIHPLKLYELPKQQRRELISFVKQASQSIISDATLRARFDSVLNGTTAGTSGRNTSQDSDATEALNILTSMLQQGLKGTTIGRNEVMLTLSVVDDLTVLVCSKKRQQYVKWWLLIWNHVCNLIMKMWGTYYEALHMEKQVAKYVDQGRFNLEQGILMTNVVMYFVFTIYSEYKDKIEKLINEIDKIEATDTFCPQCKHALL